MKHFIKSEFYKLSKSFGYKVMMTLSVGVGLFFSYFWISHSATVSGYQIIPVMDSFVMFHTIFTGMFTAVFLSREFSDRTLGMSLLCGLPRRSIFLSKCIVFFTGLIFLLSTVVAVPMVIISAVNGFGIELTAKSCMEILAQLVFFWLVSSAMGGFFIFLALATKNTAATIGTGLGISYIMLIMTSNYVNSGVEEYSVVKYSFVFQMFILADWEYLQKGLFLGVSLITLILTLIAAALIFEKAELK